MAVDRLHALTHRTPGVPPHRDRGAGHQGNAHRNAPHARRAATGAPHGIREPRVLVRWQRWIAALPSRLHRSR